MARVRDLWWTSGSRGPKAKTRKHPDLGGDKSAKRWLAVWVIAGREHTKAFAVKVDAARYASAQETDAARGTYLDPKRAKITVSQWCDTWLAGYSHRDSTVRQAAVHIAQIKTEFGDMRLGAVRPSDVKAWTARLKRDGREASYIYALHSRLGQILADAVHDHLIQRSPVSRRTSPRRGKQRPYVATTEQVWALYEQFPPYLQLSVLLGAMAGLRLAETCGLRPGDVDCALGIVYPRVQYPGTELKSEMSRTPIPVPVALGTELLAHMAQFPGETVLADSHGAPVGPWRVERAMRAARVKVPGLPAGFRFHDLRHYLASLLIASGADVKKVQARLRHASAVTTLDTYGHLWPDADESTRTALEAVFAARPEPGRNQASAV